MSTDNENTTPRRGRGRPAGPTRWTPENVKKALAARNEAERRAVAAELGTTEYAVQQVISRWRSANGATQKHHMWTEEEEHELAAIRGRSYLEAFARRVGVTFQTAQARRAKIRTERGYRPRNHRWTEAELRTVGELSSMREVKRWADRRGLSPDTALYHWKRARRQARG